MDFWRQTMPEKYIYSTYQGKRITHIYTDDLGMAKIHHYDECLLTIELDSYYQGLGADAILCDIQDIRGLNVSKNP